MYEGVFCGKNAKEVKERVLILGESHHEKPDKNGERFDGLGTKANYATADVVEDYIKNSQDIKYKFFDKIMETFVPGAIENNQRKEFWNSVYFGNYIDVLCGVGDDTAKKFLDNEKIQKLNDQLFDYVNENRINTIYCFSVLSYQNLPSLVSKEKCFMSKINLNESNLRKNFFLRYCKYLANVKHKKTRIELSHDLEIYCISHPSARCGYRLEEYQKKLTGKIQIKKPDDKDVLER